MRTMNLKVGDLIYLSADQIVDRGSRDVGLLTKYDERFDMFSIRWSRPNLHEEQWAAKVIEQTIKKGYFKHIPAQE
jgi:hypothetical protein